MPEGSLYNDLQYQDDESDVRLGSGSSAGAANVVAIGSGATANSSSAVAIGNGVTTATSNVSRIGGNQLVFGGADGGTIANADLNNGEITLEFDEANSSFVIRGKDSTGTVQSATVNFA